ITASGLARPRRPPAPIVSSSGWAARTRSLGSSGIAPGHPATELGEGLRAARRAGVVGAQPLVLGGEAVGEGHVEAVERRHLAVEPGVGPGTEAVRPGEAGAQVPDPEVLQPAHAVLQPVVLEVEPLADPELRGKPGEVPG